MTVTAIVDQHREQLVHAVNPGRIDHPAPVTRDADQPGIHQYVEMSRQLVRRDVQMFGNGACLQTFRPRLHEGPERQQPGLLPKRGELFQRVGQISHTGDSTAFGPRVQSGVKWTLRTTGRE